MENKRCPWCGKNISSGVTAMEKIKNGLSPVRMCPHCSNAFSTNISSFLLAALILIIWMFFAGSVLDFVFACILLVSGLAFAVILSLLEKYGIQRISLDGKKQMNSALRYRAKIIGGKTTPSIKKKQLLTNREFNNSPSFSVSSPILITKYSMKRAEVEFVFLYDHADNKILIENGAFEALIPNNNGYEPLMLCQIAPKKQKRQ